MEKDSKIYVAGHRGMVGSAIVRELHRQGYTNIIVRTHQEHAQVGKVVHIKELAQGTPVAPAGYGGQSLFLCFMETADQCRKHVAVFGMVIVIGTIQVGRHHADIVRAILPVQELAIFQSRYFG